ncbi:LacI family DNA-binding transcriptional regulator [Oceaniglobus trochenteri]|uniref:LacI family DNA-binding transcriptional regulator n=1 Tax=Oceaniglobus trochenteri TaxID=2763260 RepID=UPI001D0010DC|nr:LacI family DNA-binding transcriptional regulator [Oceaniglobus trochenteri]
MAATLAQVARLAGVSEITASRAIRGAPNVSSKTAAKVQDAARAIGYVQNRVAGALAGAASNQVGVILPSLSNIVFPDVLKGLETELETADFHPVLGVSHYDRDQEERLIRSLLSWRPAGIVIAPSNLTDASRRLLRDAKLPIVEIMGLAEDPIDISVGMSHFDAGKETARHLTGLGYRSFAYVGHDISIDRRALDRLDGFRHGLAEARVVLEQTILMDEPSSIGLGRKGITRALETSERPRVVYFSNDDMAVGGFFECMVKGLDVPGDIAIAGFNGLEVGQNLPRPLTTISSNREEIGRVAAEQILRRLRGQPTEKRIDVKFSLIRGETA